MPGQNLHPELAPGNLKRIGHATLNTADTNTAIMEPTIDHNLDQPATPEHAQSAEQNQSADQAQSAEQAQPAEQSANAPSAEHVHGEPAKPAAAAAPTEHLSAEHRCTGRSDDMSMADFGSVLESFEAENAELAANEDNVLKGTIVKVTDKYVVVDVGFKSEGVVPIEQVLDREGQPKFQPGDTIDVMVDRSESPEGFVLLSYEKAQRNKIWDDIESAYNEKRAVKGFVVDRVKGGLSVDIGGGVKAFLPGSQVDSRPVRNLEGYKGQEIEVRVIKLNKKRGNIVVSRKEILDEEVAGKRTQTLETSGRGRGAHRHGQEPHRLRRLRRSRRHRRPAAHHRHELGTADPSARPGAGRR